MIRLISSLTLAFCWIYEGLVPKILYPAPGDRMMLQKEGLFSGHEADLLYLIGACEIVLGCLFLVRWRRRFIHCLNIATLLLLAIITLLTQPQSFTEPFNPATLIVSMIALSAISMLAPSK
jgi:hypothetical protein